MNCGYMSRFRGVINRLHTLKIKETDRLKVMNRVNKIRSYNHRLLIFDLDCKINHNVKIATYNEQNGNGICPPALKVPISKNEAVSQNHILILGRYEENLNF
jgi:hypothetical protein